MKINEASISSINYPSVGAIKVSTLKNDFILDVDLPKIEGEVVLISGEAHMRHRLFHSDDPNIRLPLKTAHPLYSSSEPNVNFLTQEDRTFLGLVYEYAQDQGADLGYADELARGLAHHRAMATFMAPHNRGEELDSEGHMLFYSFTDKDAVIAERILASDGMKTTRLDHGFIRKATDKDYGSISHHNFEFMEKVINKFCAESDDSPLGGGFEKHVYLDRNFIEYATEERYQFNGNGAELIEGPSNNNENTLASNANSLNLEGVPDTLRDALRRMILSSLGAGLRGSLPSLADLIMKSRH